MSPRSSSTSAAYLSLPKVDRSKGGAVGDRSDFTSGMSHLINTGSCIVCVKRHSSWCMACDYCTHVLHTASCHNLSCSGQYHETSRLI